MKNQKGLGLIGFLLIIGALLLTAGGAVVWEKKVSPTPIVQPTPMPTLSGAETIPPLHKEFGKIWVLTVPHQCGTPWSRDWRQSHGDDAPYPSGEEGENKVIREYYQKQGVTIFDIELKRLEGRYVCMSCACPQGYILYLLVSNSDVQKMIDLGYQKTQ